MLRITAIGNLGRNAVQRHSLKGDFISFSIAASNGDDTVWLDCTMNGRRDALMPYLVKGKQVYIEGQAKVGTYEHGDGSYRAFVNVTVSTLQLCGVRQDLEPSQNDLQDNSKGMQSGSADVSPF